MDEVSRQAGAIYDEVHAILNSRDLSTQTWCDAQTARLRELRHQMVAHRYASYHEYKDQELEDRLEAVNRLERFIDGTIRDVAIMAPYADRR